MFIIRVQFRLASFAWIEARSLSGPPSAARHRYPCKNSVLYGVSQLNATASPDVRWTYYFPAPTSLFGVPNILEWVFFARCFFFRFILVCFVVCLFIEYASEIDWVILSLSSSSSSSSLAFIITEQLRLAFLFQCCRSYVIRSSVWKLSRTTLTAGSDYTR